MKKINLWLDDERSPPPGFIHVKTAPEMIALLSILDSQCVHVMSLDHDLGLEHGTGYDVVCWMEEHQWWPQKRPQVHSANPVGKARMLQVIEKTYSREK